MAAAATGKSVRARLRRVNTEGVAWRPGVAIYGGYDAASGQRRDR